MHPFLQRSLLASNFICGLPKEIEAPEDYASLLPWFLVPAIALGIGTLLLGLLFTLPLPPMATALLGSMAIVLFWLAVSRGQNLLAAGTIAHVLEVQLSAGDGSREEGATLSRQLAIFVVLILKLGCVAILLHKGGWGGLWWLFLVPVYSVFYAMEMSNYLGYFGENPELSGPKRAVAVSLFLALGLVGGFKGLFAALFIWLLCHMVGTWGRQKEAEFRAVLVNGGSELTETLMLLLGVILLN